MHRPSILDPSRIDSTVMAQVAQIAQQVGISQMHVSRLIRRSLEKIRQEIAADETSTTSGSGLY